MRLAPPFKTLANDKTGRSYNDYGIVEACDGSLVANVLLRSTLVDHRHSESLAHGYDRPQRGDLADPLPLFPFHGLLLRGSGSPASLARESRIAEASRGTAATGRSRVGLESQRVWRCTRPPLLLWGSAGLSRGHAHAPAVFSNRYNTCEARACRLQGAASRLKTFWTSTAIRVASMALP